MKSRRLGSAGAAAKPPANFPAEPADVEQIMSEGRPIAKLPDGSYEICLSDQHFDCSTEALIVIPDSPSN